MSAARPSGQIELYREHHQRIADEVVPGDGWTTLYLGANWRVPVREGLPRSFNPNTPIASKATMKVVEFYFEEVILGSTTLTASTTNGIFVVTDEIRNASAEWWHHPKIDAVETAYAARRAAPQ